MDTLVSELQRLGYTRTNLPLSRPLVIHAVAGAGKSTLLRHLLTLPQPFYVQTHGIPDPPNLSQRYIRPANVPLSNHFNILDEYPAVPVKGSWDALIADPLQHPENCLPPHFTRNVTHRFGPDTCSLLSSLGIDIVSAPDSEQDTLTLSPIFEGTLQGQILALDTDCARLLEAHGVPFLCPRKVLGLEFPTVTVVSLSPLKQHPSPQELYIALTRHRKELHVLAPPPYPTSRPH
uniref:Triple gene block protein1 n=1 Tax=Hydrangea ringspot virus TaxID=112228 RepID=A0A125SVE8_9VIRU|nr:triple gene block protein1 [Hydrangea ringspot virus]BAU45641.1 triple gene block protein1 [Hydrangea ringspot virus]